MLGINQWITLFVLMYLHILAPRLPTPIENTLKNPLVKTLGIFWLLYQKTQLWKFSLLIASGIVVVLEGANYFMYGREAFCSFTRIRSCPQGDHCVDETPREEKVMSFLSDNDQFIKNLYKYVDADAPDSVVEMN